MVPRLRVVLVFAAVAAGAAIMVALGSEWWDGLVPCPLCLLERWPYRAALVLALAGVVLPRHLARLAGVAVLLAVLAAAGLGLVHVGVEQGWWASPLPECAAPRFSGGTIAQRLAHMPLHPSKACEDPTYLIPGLPLSMASMNLLYALAFAVFLATFLWRSRWNER